MLLSGRIRPWLLAGVAVVALGAGGAAWWWASSGDPAAPDPFAVHHGADAGERGQLDSAERTLAGLPAALARGDTASLTAQGTSTVGRAPGAVLPPDTVLTVDRPSWRRTGTVASVLVSARRPGQAAPAVFLVLLRREGDRWLVSQTFPQASATPAPAAS